MGMSNATLQYSKRLEGCSGAWQGSMVLPKERRRRGGPKRPVSQYYLDPEARQLDS